MLFSPVHLAFASMWESLLVVVVYRKGLSWLLRASLESPLQGGWATVTAWGYQREPREPPLSQCCDTGASLCRLQRLAKLFLFVWFIALLKWKAVTAETTAELEWVSRGRTWFWRCSRNGPWGFHSLETGRKRASVENSLWRCYFLNVEGENVHTHLQASTHGW